jgi:hypothetical protein
MQANVAPVDWRAGSWSKGPRYKRLGVEIASASVDVVEARTASGSHSNSRSEPTKGSRKPKGATGAFRRQRRGDATDSTVEQDLEVEERKEAFRSGGSLRTEAASERRVLDQRRGGIGRGDAARLLARGMLRRVVAPLGTVAER